MANEHRPEEPEPRADACFIPEGIPIARPVLVADVALAFEPAHEMLLEDSSRRSVCVDMAVVVLGLIALELLSQVALYFATGIGDLPDAAPDSDVLKVLIMPLMPARAALVTIVVALLLAWRHQSLRSVGVSFERFGVNLLLGLAALGVAYGLIIPWALAMQYLMPAMAESLNENAEAIMSFLPRQSPIHFLWMFLAVGIYEELLFRGFLMTRLRRLTGGWTWAAIVSSILFIVPHLFEQKAIALVPIGILAAVFCVVTIWRRSIVPAIVAHWLFDWSQLLGLYFAYGDTWQ